MTHSGRGRAAGHGALPRPWRGGRGRASPRQGGPTHPRLGTWAPRPGATCPPCRGQALPDPPAREGRQITGDTHRRSVAIIAACREASRVCRAVRRGRARQRLAPTTWRGAFPVGHLGATSGCSPRSVGVRRCLTRPACPGRQTISLPFVRCATGVTASRCVPRVAAPAARAGEAAPRPYKGVVHHRAGGYPTHIGSA